MQDDVAALEEAKLEWSGFRACVYITKHAAARGSGGQHAPRKIWIFTCSESDGYILWSALAVES